MAAVDLGAAEWERSKISTQDINMLKKLGISKKPKALCFPSEESYPSPPMGYRVSFVDHLIRGLSAPIHPFLRGLLFIYGLQLHHLTPNSILHISIFITLCEAFLGVRPNWALERIFFCRRNGSPNVAYNIGGVVIFVRPTVDYFDVKLLTQFKDGARSGCTFRRRTMDVRRTTSLLLMVPRKSFAAAPGDAEATEEERASTETLMARIHELQNTHGKSYRNHPDLVSLPPLPEGGEVEERAIVTDDNQEAPSFVNEPVDSRKSAGSSEGTASALSPPPVVSPKGKRKRNDVKDSGTSKAEDFDPSRQKATYDPYLASLVSSDDEEEVPTRDVAPRTSASHTLRVSETPIEGEESSPPQQNVVTTTPPSSPLAPSPKRTRVETIIEPAPQLGSSSHSLLDDPMIKELVRIGSQFIGYREYASRTEEKLAEANRLADTLAQKLEQSETARKKAELDASQAKVEADEAKAKAASQTSQDFDLENPTNDPLLDALSYLEFHGQEIREGVVNADAGLSKLFPYFFPKKEEPKTFLALAKDFNPSEDLGLKMRQENMKVAVENTIALVAAVNKLLTG
ncbi:hypothetical protein QYE76_048565 [Lolium multiflorum]|uniref:Transposase (putative) gypsy type domain-containing protein n=1 Tax=Lolium multiflorum TaxID=4521 RepID=A0AAD8SL56_LOLMU|nr:hypothetical protein QYE76_048565 [Lolium multiflorum]